MGPKISGKILGHRLLKTG